MAQALAAAGVDTRRIKLIGTGGWEGIPPNLHASAHGAWLAAPEISGWRDFVARYTKAYGSAPPRIATLAYDAIGVAIILSSSNEPRRFAAADLLKPNGFVGAEGPFRFTTSGVSERALSIVTVSREGPQVIELAAFPGAKPAPLVPGPSASIYSAPPDR